MFTYPEFSFITGVGAALGLFLPFVEVLPCSSEAAFSFSTLTFSLQKPYQLMQ